MGGSLGATHDELTSLKHEPQWNTTPYELPLRCFSPHVYGVPGSGDLGFDVVRRGSQVPHDPEPGEDRQDVIGEVHFPP